MLKHLNNKRKGSRGKKHPQRRELGKPIVSSLVPVDGILRNKHDYTFMLPFEQVSVSTYNWGGTSAAIAGSLTMTPSATLSNICDVYRIKQIKITLTANVSSPIAAITRYAVAYDPTSASALNYSAVARYADSISWSPSADNPSLEIIIKNPAAARRRTAAGRSRCPTTPTGRTPAAAAGPIPAAPTTTPDRIARA
jgi:hypothetical protein